MPVLLDGVEALARRALAALPAQYSADLSRMGLSLPEEAR